MVSFLNHSNILVSSIAYAFIRIFFLSFTLELEKSSRLKASELPEFWVLRLDPSGENSCVI